MPAGHSEGEWGLTPGIITVDHRPRIDQILHRGQVPPRRRTMQRLFHRVWMCERVYVCVRESE